MVPGGLGDDEAAADPSSFQWSEDLGASVALDLTEEAHPSNWLVSGVITQPFDKSAGRLTKQGFIKKKPVTDDPPSRNWNTRGASTK